MTDSFQTQATPERDQGLINRATVLGEQACRASIVIKLGEECFTRRCQLGAQLCSQSGRGRSLKNRIHG